MPCPGSTGVGWGPLSVLGSSAGLESQAGPCPWWQGRQGAGAGGTHWPAAGCQPLGCAGWEGRGDTSLVRAEPLINH